MLYNPHKPSNLLVLGELRHIYKTSAHKLHLLNANNKVGVYNMKNLFAFFAIIFAAALISAVPVIGFFIFIALVCWANK